MPTLEERLYLLADRLPEPDTEVGRRIWLELDEPANRRRRVPILVIALAVIVFTAGAAIAAAKVISAGDALSMSGGDWHSLNRSYDYGEGGVTALGPSPGALRFAPGISYPEALTELYEAQQTDSPPANAELVDPLPVGKVAIIPTSDDESVVIDLAAPYGYDPSNLQVAHVTIVQEAGLSAQEAESQWEHLRPDRPWPPNSWIAIPILPACEVITARDDQGVACAPSNLLGMQYGRRLGPLLP
jgi:hypothetical protein